MMRNWIGVFISRSVIGRPFRIVCLALLIVPAIFVVSSAIPNGTRIQLLELKLRPILKVGTRASTIRLFLDQEQIRHSERHLNLCGYDYLKYQEYKELGGKQPCQDVHYIYAGMPTRFTVMEGEVNILLYLDDDDKLETHHAWTAWTFL